MIDITTIYAKRMMDRSNYIESLKLITNYYKNCKQKCNHNDYIDMGYYKVYKGKYYITNRQDAEFRIVKCSECDTCIMLIKTDNVMWDILYGNKEINIITIKPAVKALAFAAGYFAILLAW